VVRLNFDKGALGDYPAELVLHFQHATHADNDRILNLVRAPRDQYIGYLKQGLREGVWHVMLSTEDWRLVQRVHWKNGLDIRLSPQ